MDKEHKSTYNQLYNLARPRKDASVKVDKPKRTYQRRIKKPVNATAVPVIHTVPITDDRTIIRAVRDLMEVHASGLVTDANLLRVLKDILS